MIIDDCDVFVRIISMPCRVRGIVIPNDDGTFSVYINERLDHVARHKAYEHELRHIAFDHFYDEKTIAEVESEASSGAQVELF